MTNLENLTLEQAAEAVEQRLEAAGLFFGHGTDNAWDEAVWLVLHATGGDPGADAIDWARKLDAGRARAVERLVAERIATRRPLAYLINEAWFAGQRFYVDERAIVPRSFLGEWVPERFEPWIDSSRVAHIADLCTGGGCIAVALAQAFPEAKVAATDLSAEALEVAAINVERHQVGERVSLHRGDLFEGLEGTFDLVVCNPPYVADERMAELPREYDFEPAMAFRGGADGLDLVVRILREAGRYLAPGGTLVVEAGTSGPALERRFPAVPFTWLSTASEEQAVFLMTAEELALYRGEFAAVGAAPIARYPSGTTNHESLNSRSRSMHDSKAVDNHVLFEQAKRFIPGGVNSPVRAFKSVGGDPVFIRRAEGAYLFGEDGRRYIDYVGSWGPMILGHAAPAVILAVQEAAESGLSFGAPTVLETGMAELLCERLPWLDKVRMVSSGTEATMSAIRLARGFTGRDKLVKFEGCYHGHADSLLVKAGSGALTFGVPTSPGVPESVARDTLTATYNDLESVQALFAANGDAIAAVILEPVAGNMNCVPPVEGFLQGLRDLCDRHGSLLIMDEVMTGFRVGPRGAQGLYGVQGDLTTLGKIVGGGMPVGAFGGRAEVMAQLAPEGGVYQAGTLSGNPVAMAAGLATLRGVAAEGFYPALEEQTKRLVEGILGAAREVGVPMSANRVGAMFGLFFTETDPVTRYDEVMASDADRFRRFFHGMLDEGIYLAPSAFEAGFVSAAHTNEDIDATVAAARKILGTL